MSLQAVSFDAPAFSVERALRDPRKEAAELAERRRDAGFDEGYTTGWAAAEAEVAAAIDDHRRNAQRLASGAAAFERAAEQLRNRDEVSLAQIERDMIALAVALAEEIVGRELASLDAPVREALERVAGLLPDRGVPVVRVHPDDEATAREAVEADIVRWTREVDLIADPGVEPGGCIVDVGPCRIDGQVGTALARLREALA